MYELPLFFIGLLAADIDMSTKTDDVSDFQYTAVVVKAAVNIEGAGNGGAALNKPSAGDPILGILQNSPNQGEAGTVMAQGLSGAKISGTVHIGDILATDADGALKVATGGQYGVAQAMEEAVDGDFATVYVKNFGKQ